MTATTYPAPPPPLFPWKWLEHDFLGPDRRDIGRITAWANTDAEGARVHLANTDFRLRVPLEYIIAPVRVVALVACAKTKTDCPARARHLYNLSTLFRAASTWAEAHADRWYILSAKHGLLHPDQVLEPYDTSLYDLPAHGRREWSDLVFDQLLNIPAPQPQDPLRAARAVGTTWTTPLRTAYVILAGQVYSRHLVASLDAAGYQVILPLAGLGYGRQVQWLQNNHRALMEKA